MTSNIQKVILICDNAEKNQQEVLAMTNIIQDVVEKNNVIFAEKWEVTHDHIDHCLEDILLLKNQVVDLEGLSGLQQTTLQHCQDKIAGLEETVAQLVTLVKKMEKMVCQCHNQLLLLGPHYMLGEEEMVEETEEEGEEEEEDGLEYTTDTPSGGSYMTPPSTGGRSLPSLAPSPSSSSRGSDPETNAVLCTEALEACIKAFLEEVDEDLEMNDPPLLKNTPLLLVLAPVVPGSIPSAVSTGQHCVLPKSLRKVYHPYKDSIG